MEDDKINSKVKILKSDIIENLKSDWYKYSEDLYKENNNSNKYSLDVSYDNNINSINVDITELIWSWSYIEEWKFYIELPIDIVSDNKLYAEYLDAIVKIVNSGERWIDLIFKLHPNSYEVQTSLESLKLHY